MGKVVSSIPNAIAGLLGGGVDKPSPAASTTAEPVDLAAQEEEAMAQRRRGRLGTIATSFRGVLESADTAPQRRTLLGE